jgi:hypothetical protein
MRQFRRNHFSQRNEFVLHRMPNLSLIYRFVLVPIHVPSRSYGLLRLEPSGLDLDYVAIVQTNSSDLTALGPILVAFTQVTIVIGDSNARCGHAESSHDVPFASPDLDARNFFGRGLLHRGLKRYRRGNRFRQGGGWINRRGRFALAP